MDIAVTGSHGLIGRALIASLESDGHRVIPVVRGAATANAIVWDPESGTIDAGGLEGLDAVVHLAGEGIASKPWTASQRRRIHDSRAVGTKLLSDTLAGLHQPPATLISGSAIGFYGDRGSEVLTEHSTPGTGFLAEVCTAWEDATAAAEEAGIRTVHIRTGIVLDRRGGALAAQLPIFRLGLGGRAGNGQQWMSWITLHDEVAAIRHLIDHPEVSGPVNLGSPNPVTNADFTQALGATLHRPTFMVIPKVVGAVPFGVGDLVESLLFSSARIQPEVLLGSGFSFSEPTIESALATVLDRA
ncbi:MAG: TIGR01777 family oxidoreductase [Aquihabitans sp.]